MTTKSIQSIAKSRAKKLVDLFYNIEIGIEAFKVNSSKKYALACLDKMTIEFIKGFHFGQGLDSPVKPKYAEEYQILKAMKKEITNLKFKS